MRYYYQGFTKEGTVAVLGNVSEENLTTAQLNDLRNFSDFIGRDYHKLGCIVFPLDNGVLSVQIKEWAAFAIIKEEE